MNTPVYLTAVTNARCVTVSGPPKAIADFEANHLPSTAIASQPAHIYALYHAPVLQTTKEQVLSDIQRRGVRFPDYKDLKCSLRSTIDGNVISSRHHRTGSTLVEDILDMILVHPVHFDEAIERLSADLLAEEAGSVSLVNVGPGTGLWRSAVRMLQDGGLVVEGIDWSSPPAPGASTAEVPVPPPQQEVFVQQPTTVPKTITTQSGGIAPQQRFQKEPIAIVGMAVNFPGAPDVAQFWKVLKDGLNTLSEVCMTRS